MKIAFVYAGQGSQRVGMGKDFYEQYPTFQSVFDQAEPDFDLASLCFQGPEEQLAQTRFTQPCMVAFAVGMTDLLYAEGIRPSMVAGLSLGEYSALYAAGVFDTETVISLAAFRGKAMEQAVQSISCGMAAILGLEREKLQQACDDAQAEGIVEIANYNCPGQLVIGGESAAVAKAGELALNFGAKRCVPLKVSGPFHTSLMAPAAEALHTRFETTAFGSMQIPLIFNATGKPLEEGLTIARMLERQVQTSVRFEDSIRYMESQGVDTIVEIGPGKTLSGFIRKTTPHIKTYAIDDIAGFMAVIEALKGAYS